MSKEKKPKDYHVDPEALETMSPAQQAVIPDMLRNHARMSWLVDLFLPRGNLLLDLRLKQMGLSRDEAWMPIVDALAKMDAEKFDTLLVEMHHYTTKGIEAGAHAGDSTRSLELLEPASV